MGIPGHNIVKYSNKTAKECSEICDRTKGCLSFEYGADHGHDETSKYKVSDCQLQTSNTGIKNCIDEHNLDLYVKDPDCTGLADFVDWQLCKVDVHSNLGNLGPHKGEHEIRFTDVINLTTGSIDLVVTSLTNYVPKNTEKNGETDCFGLINVKEDSSVNLSFRFVQSGTNNPVEVGESMFTVYDIDTTKDQSNIEEITFFTPVSSYWLTNTSELQRSGSLDGGLTFRASKKGNLGDNPADPMNLTQLQKDRAVTVESDGVDGYAIEFKVIRQSGSGDYGRNFMFAGKSLLVDAEGSARFYQ